MAEPDPTKRSIDVIGVGGVSSAPTKESPNARSFDAEDWLEIVDALTRATQLHEIYDLIVDRVSRVVRPLRSGLWIRDADVLHLARHVGYTSRADVAFTEMSLDSGRATPILSSFHSAEPIWLPSQGCLPLAADGVAHGVLHITLADEQEPSYAEHAFLDRLSRYAARALERVRNGVAVVEAIEARRRAEQLYRFANAAVNAQTLDAVFEAALTAISEALQVKRASVLLFDDEGVMRFRAWRGLSDRYRAAVDGHSPWKRDADAPTPLLVPDPFEDEAWASYCPQFQSEGIGALAFIPLISRGQLLGKFMVYYDQAHHFTSSDVDVSRAIANYLGSTIARFRAVADLERSVHENELFAGVLAHDLRNPLGAIVTATQLALMQTTGANERLHKPLTRILSSSDRMSNMIAQLLDFTRARVGGGIELQSCRTNLDDIARQAVGELQLIYPERTIKLTASGDTHGEWDPDRLLQVVSNLVGNACQHGNQASLVSVTIDGTDRERATLIINNAGVIPSAILPRVFDPFRGREHRHGSARGLGLGLYIVREIVRCHHGTVDVTRDRRHDVHRAPTPLSRCPRPRCPPALPSPSRCPLPALRYRLPSASHCPCPTAEP